MDNSNNQELTFEEAVKAISERNSGGDSNHHNKDLKKTAKDDTDNKIPTMGFFRNL